MKILIPHENIAAAAHVLHSEDLTQIREACIRTIRAASTVWRTRNWAPRRRVTGDEWWRAMEMTVLEDRVDLDDVALWRDHQRGLMLYHDALRREMIRRGIRSDAPCYALAYDPELLHPIVANARVRAEHRRELLSMRPDYYSAWGWQP